MVVASGGTQGKRGGKAVVCGGVEQHHKAHRGAEKQVVGIVFGIVHAGEINRTQTEANRKIQAPVCGNKRFDKGIRRQGVSQHVGHVEIGVHQRNARARVAVAVFPGAGFPQMPAQVGFHHPGVRCGHCVTELGRVLDDEAAVHFHAHAEQRGGGVGLRVCTSGGAAEE